MPADSILDLASGLQRDGAGIWTAAASPELAYPKDGNDRYFRLEDRSYWFRHRNDCILSALQRFPPQGVVLDVGGGNGFVTRRILDEGYPAALVEPGPAGAFNAKVHRGIPDVYCMTFEALGPRPGSVGAIGCFDVLEHIAEPAALMARFHGALRPGGLFYATLPALGWLWSASDVEAGHYRRYDRAAIADLLAPGFETLHVTALFSVLTLPVLLLRALPYRLGWGGGALKAETEHGADDGPMTRWIRRRLDRELARIRAGGRRAIGTSYLVVARKRGVHG